MRAALGRRPVGARRGNSPLALRAVPPADGRRTQRLPVMRAGTAGIVGDPANTQDVSAGA